MSTKEVAINILDYLPNNAIQIDLKAQTKKEVIKEMVEVMTTAHNLGGKDKILDALLEREDLGSTGIGQGVAIPHAKSDQIKNVVAALGISKKGIDYDALDGEPVYIFFALMAPTDSAGLHLKILAKISRLLKDKFFRQNLREAKTSDEAVHQIREENEF